MKSHQFGRHTLNVDDEGVATLIYRGNVSVEDMKALLSFEDHSNPPVVSVLICDIREMGKLEPSARRLGATAPKPSKRYLTAYLGAGFALRTVIDMWIRATNFMHGPKYVVKFFDDAPSARAWLVAKKQALLTELRKSP